MTHIEALVLARAGRLEAAAALSRRALEVASREGHRESAAMHEAAPAVWNAFFGNAPLARQHVGR